jgi:hypothetical protein
LDLSSFASHPTLTLKSRTSLQENFTMKFLKFFLYLVLVLVAIFLIVPVFLSKQATFSKSIVIHQPANVVYAEITDLRTWTNWDHWSKIDLKQKTTFTGEVGKTGFKRAWESEHPQVGCGAMTLTELKSNAFVKTHMDFLKPRKGEADATFELETTPEGTKVTWTFLGEFSYPMQWMGLMIAKMVGPDFEDGLANLKTTLEAKPTSLENPKKK